MKIKIWGSRGSIAIPGKETVKFGGNTSCVTVEIDDIFIIFDAGSGIRIFGDWLIRTGKKFEGNIFLTHFHWDHIHGFPFFTPVYSPETKLNIYGPANTDKTVIGIFEGHMVQPTFPVTIDIMQADMNFFDLNEKETVGIKSKDTLIATVQNARLNHPNGAIGYRIDHAESNKSVVYATDTEHFETGLPDKNVVSLAKGADVLFYDAQYTEDDYYGLNGKMSKKGWGHSTWKEGIKVADIAGVKRLILFHHDPVHADSMLSAIENKAKEHLKNNRANFQKLGSVEMAYEGLTIDLD
mmetsp:Transcript_2616/g.1582  ORF Transcript_2616/g.1582 Transcript_2616/m.1582 type:complete len:296 (+) Transcript_2616:222-1109(+)